MTDAIVIRKGVKDTKKGCVRRMFCLPTLELTAMDLCRNDGLCVCTLYNLVDNVPVGCLRRSLDLLDPPIAAEANV